MLKRIFPVLLLLLSMLAKGQSAELHGRVVDSKSKQPLVGVHVRLMNHADTTDAIVVQTGPDGIFRFSEVRLISYQLEATAVGFLKLTKLVRVDRADVNLGDLVLTETIISLGEVISEVRVPTAVQKADTTEFNAKAFKVNKDAVAEDLLAKMPGITVDNGNVQAQGEDVQAVLLDGKPFFGNDATIALRNLPADAIDKIQVFDKMSDQAAFTGFDDGQSVKTLNIVTRPERRNGQFGKTYAGYGDDARYLAGGNFNSFGGDTRVSVLGLTNNVNQQNFSTQDIVGAIGGGGGFGGRGGRGGGGYGGRRLAGGGGGGFGGGLGFGTIPGMANNVSSFLVGQQNGITTTNSIGTNYTDNWWNGFTASQSYFFNLADNENNQKLRRQYILSTDTSSLYNENTNSGNKNYNHRYDGRFEYTIDSSNSMILTPSLSFQNNNASSSLAGASTLSDGSMVSQTANNNTSSNSGNNLSAHLVVRHRFDTPGRTVSVDFGASSNHKSGTGVLQSVSDYYRSVTSRNDTLDQQSSTLTNSSSLSARVVYTEPLWDINQLQFTYNPSYSKNTSDNRRFNFDSLTRGFTDLATGLSNTYDNTYTTQRASVGYRLRLIGFTAMADLAYQIAMLDGNQVFPYTGVVDKKFYNVLPSANVNYSINDHTNLRMFYRTSTSAPSISQLQNVVDNSNPLLLSSGNPNLQQSYTHTFVSRYGVTSTAKSQSMFVLFSAAYTANYIANSTITAQRDSVVTGGIILHRGTQLTLPVNLSGNWNVRSFFTQGLPVEFMKSNLNLNLGFNYARTPGLINQGLNVSNASVASAGAVISSNISEDVDFTLSYSGNYNVSRYSLQPQLNSNYFNGTGSIKLNVVFWDGWVFRNETYNTLYTGLSGGFNQNYYVWNVSLAKKIFENQRGEIRAAVSDLLNQNQSVNRNVTETYVEDTQYEVLGRYYMVQFTYTLR